MSAVSRAEGTLSARFPLDDVGGNRAGGVLGIGGTWVTPSLVDDDDLASGGVVLMFRSGFRRALRRAVSEACIIGVRQCRATEGGRRRREMRT